MNDMEILDKAVGKVGSIQELAVHMGMSPKALYAWKARKRVPLGWRAYLAEKVVDPNWPTAEARDSA